MLSAIIITMIKMRTIFKAIKEKERRVRVKRKSENERTNFIILIILKI